MDDKPDKPESQSGSPTNDSRLNLLEVQIKRHERFEKNTSKLARLVDCAISIVWDDDKKS
jgi:hypothetical protein